MGGCKSLPRVSQSPVSVDRRSDAYIDTKFPVDHDWYEKASTKSSVMTGGPGACLRHPCAPEGQPVALPPTSDVVDDALSLEEVRQLADEEWLRMQEREFDQVGHNWRRQV